MSAAELTRRQSQVSTRSVDYVGFANFPNQVFRRCIKDGFEFTLMVVGQSGLGKSTFINTLFLTELSERSAPSDTRPTVTINSKTVCLVENDVRLKLTLVDTPGFGDAVNNANCWDPIIQFVDQKYAEYLTEETKIERAAKIEDKRVHLCLYFIAPTGHGLRELDIAFMKALQDRVNIVPVIAKADTLTPAELTRFKQNIVQDLQTSGIKLYEFPPPEPVVDDSKTAEYHSRIPFAVIGSSEVKEVGKYKVRIREYPWGTVEVENLSHNDFVPLRDMIIRSNLIDLIDVTRNVHYENFRYRQMSKMPKGSLDHDPFTQLEQEQREREREAEETRQAKENIFSQKVAEREQKLRDRADKLDAEEKENENIVNAKRAQLEQLMQEMAELRRPTGASDSGSSIGRGSPTEKTKKKGMSLFRSNN